MWPDFGMDRDRMRRDAKNIWSKGEGASSFKDSEEIGWSPGAMEVEDAERSERSLAFPERLLIRCLSMP